MALLKFISLSVGSLMLLQGAYAKDTVDKEKAKDCLGLMNTARSQVGLPELKETTPQYLTLDPEPASELLQALCNQMKVNKPIVISKSTNGAFKGSVVAYLPSGESCSAAVDEWKKGFSQISADSKTLPPTYTVSAPSRQLKTPAEGSEVQTPNAPYNVAPAVNFAALFNPQTDASAECAVVTCTATAPNTTGLVCMTYPTSLTDKAAPYDDAQWKKILAVFAPESSSASAAVPTLLALAAAAVGVALM